MTTNLKDYFKKAQQGNWAIGQFNTSNLETLKAILGAAKKLKSPVIIGTSEGESGFLGLGEAVNLVKFYRKKLNLPVFLNLDHGRSLEYIKGAIGAGYDSVHFDGSFLSIQENIKITQKIIQYARPKKVLVEGGTGTASGVLTKPAEAKKFIQETKADSLTVNIGTLHGLSKPKIDFERLKAIRKEAEAVPLVLHGGSGIPREDIEKVIKLGIAKININTELRMAYTHTLRKALKDGPEEITPYKYMPSVIAAVQKVVEEKIKLLGSHGKNYS